jgi:DNA-binding response OmpR family regulator
MKILILDDEREILDLLESMLEREDVEIETTTMRCEAALMMAINRYDWLLFDYHLPDGNSLEIFETIGCSMDKVVLLTADPNNPELKVKADILGLHAIFDKGEGLTNAVKYIKSNSPQVYVMHAKYFSTRNSSPVFGSHTCR